MRPDQFALSRVSVWSLSPWIDQSVSVSSSKQKEPAGEIRPVQGKGVGCRVGRGVHLERKKIAQTQLQIDKLVASSDHWLGDVVLEGPLVALSPYNQLVNLADHVQSEKVGHFILSTSSWVDNCTASFQLKSESWSPRALAALKSRPPPKWIRSAKWICSATWKSPTKWALELWFSLQ